MFQYGIQEGSGIAVYDIKHFAVEAVGKVNAEAVIDALVIGSQYNIQPLLLDTLTPGKDPFILKPRLVMFKPSRAAIGSTMLSYSFYQSK